MLINAISLLVIYCRITLFSTLHTLRECYAECNALHYRNSVTLGVTLSVMGGCTVLVLLTPVGDSDRTGKPDEVGRSASGPIGVPRVRLTLRVDPRTTQTRRRARLAGPQSCVGTKTETGYCRYTHLPVSTGTLLSADNTGS